MKKILFAMVVATASPASGYSWTYAHGELVSDGITRKTYSDYHDTAPTLAIGSWTYDLDPNSADAGSQAYFGLLGVYAHMTNFLYSDPTGAGVAEYRDVITATGTSPVTLQLSIQLSGALDATSNYAKMVTSLDVTGTGNTGQLLHLQHDEQVTGGTRSVGVDDTVGQVTINPGDSIAIDGFLAVSTNNNISLAGTYSAGDYYHTAESLIRVLTPGGGYSSESGTLYAVPEPATITETFVGLAALTALRRRRPDVKG